jgi:hypothetical protein
MRMRQLYFDENVKNLLFIRYNPDAYTTIDGKSCYTNKQRQSYLLSYLRAFLEGQTFENLSVAYLFYDGFINDVEIEKIDAYSA